MLKTQVIFYIRPQKKSPFIEAQKKIEEEVLSKKSFSIEEINLSFFFPQNTSEIGFILRKSQKWSSFIEDLKNGAFFDKRPHKNTNK